jgi:hypothetical protein
MTDNAELIAEVRRRRTDHPTQTSDGPLLDRLADALEAADQRVESLKRSLDNMRALATLYGKNWDDEREKSASLAAVVEKVRERAESIRRDYAALDRHEADNIDWGMSLAASLILRDVEASAPADALREVRAAAWDEGWNTGYEDRG